MSIRSLLQLRGVIETIQGGSNNIGPTDLQNTLPPYDSIQLVLANGANTIIVPYLAAVIVPIGALIIPDLTSTTVKKIKGIAGDTGIQISKSHWSLLSFDDPPPASFVIDSAGADTGKTTTIIFF